MRALVIVNPNATTTSARTLEVLLSALRHDLKLDVAQTDHRNHATELARQARQDGLDLVIAFGGDGTVNEAVNGLLADGPGDDVPHLGVVPGGSTNVFARNLGIPLDPVEATGALLDAVRGGLRRQIGLGVAGDRWFTFAAGLGLDADVIRAVEERRTGGARASAGLYVRTAIRRFFATPKRRQPGTISMAVDGQDLADGLHLAVITNCAPWTYLGPRPVELTPGASFDEGLDAAAFRRLGLARSLASVAAMVGSRRGPQGRDVLVVHDALEIRLESDDPAPFHVDGDYLGARESVVCRAVPNALLIVCDKRNTTV